MGPEARVTASVPVTQFMLKHMVKHEHEKDPRAALLKYAKKTEGTENFAAARYDRTE